MTYAFLVQSFENATIVAYAGLRVKCFDLIHANLNVLLEHIELHVTPHNVPF